MNFSSSLVFLCLCVSTLLLVGNQDVEASYYVGSGQINRALREKFRDPEVKDLSF